ncbi:MAG: glycosyltransferase family 2 protein [Erysipelotrichaceae bacterium]|nr:glycosyltransferase family 2 protein [Erysipelotrichaceae bacterium]
MCTLTIIVPVYNGEKSLKRCVESILAQDYKDFEALLIDDGSKDDSYKIMSEFAKEDERIIPIHKENGGVSSTRNLGLEKARGKYIQFIDVDDWLPFDSAKLMVRAMEENKADMVIGDFYRVVDDKISKKGSIREGGMITRNLFADKMMITPADFYYGALWNKLYRKEIIDKYKIRMDENISYCEDTIFNLEYLLHANLIYVLKSPVYYYVKTEGSLVEQNLNIENTVRMKTSVIRYYNDFYKNIMDEDDYEERKLIIYGYLLAVSTDAFALPFIDKAKKLGDETGGKVYLSDELADSELVFSYLCNNMFNQLLNAIGEQNKVDSTGIRILYYLYKSKEKCSSEEIARVCGLNGPLCLMHLTKLVASGCVKISEVNLFDENKVLYEYIPGKYDELFVKAEEDYERICFDGLNNDDKEKFREMRKIIFSNIRKTLLK